MFRGVSGGLAVFRGVPSGFAVLSGSVVIRGE